MRYAQIRSMDISNGEGIGVALFVQGCHFHCKNCFNQETWDFNGGKLWTPEIRERFLDLVFKPYIKRVSILGGEPLADENVSDVSELLYRIKMITRHRKSIWLYTGYDYEALQKNNNKSVVDSQRLYTCGLADIVVDGRYDEDLKDYNLKFRGSSNQRIIDVQATLSERRVVLYEERG